MSQECEYDVALSFAGEDRDIVEEIANILKNSGVSVFYDRYREVNLWGKDLAEHLDEIYRRKSRYCVIFISKHCAEKMWPTEERRSALARAVEQKGEYILPVRLDDTEMPGIRPTIAYLDIERYPPPRLAEALLEKLGVTPRQEPREEEAIVDSRTHSLYVFAERMAEAFPGARGLVEVTETQQIKASLDTILKSPLRFDAGESLYYYPIWWWRGTLHNSIKRYEYVDEFGYFLINYRELKITKLMAHRSWVEDMEFLYVETSAAHPSGIYDLTTSDLERMVTEWGFASEELGYYKGRYISRAEYDDGYANINGEVVALRDMAELRVRHLTPFNLLIAAKASRINNNSIDFTVRDLLNAILMGTSALDELVELLRRTGRRDFY